MTEEFRFNNYARAVEVAPERRSRAPSPSDTDWYEWRVFMDEPPEKLDLVSHVEYRLHQTFVEPIRTVFDRNSHFALDSSGWGEFVIHITIYLKDGTESYAKYALDLSKPPPPDSVPVNPLAHL